MHKYEIMIMLDPKAEEKVASSLVESIFKKQNIVNSQKLENTDLAYEINKSNKAQFFLYELNAEPNVLTEFTRRANIIKELWRYIVINLDNEKGYGKKRKQRPRKKFTLKDNQERRPRRRVYNNDENKSSSYSNRNKEDSSEEKNYTKKTTSEKRTYTRTKKSVE